jgi:Tfp pilus assembly protein PilF
MRLANMVVAMSAGFVLLAGCATGPAGEAANPFAALFQPSKSEQALSAGIKQFEDGEYADATKTLQSALDLGLTSAPDRTKAHKYLAFIHCVSGRQKQCQDEFRKALEITPAMELDPSEVGHPIWGPEFRSAKARSK